MLEKQLKIIQSGRVSFVPDNKQNRQFWSKQNTLVSRSQSARDEMVTIIPATDAEMEELNALLTPKQVTIVPVVNNEMEALKQQLAQQQELINKLLLSQIPVKNDPNTTAASESEPVKEKGKPGPKPKTETNGEGK